MTITETLDARDHAQIAVSERECARLLALLADCRAKRHAARKEAGDRKNYALLELDHGERRNARFHRRLALSARVRLLTLKQDALLAMEDYRASFSDITALRRDIGRRNSPAYSAPRYYLGGRAYSTRELVEGVRP